MSTRAKTEYIIVHCAATGPSMDIGAKEIKVWHTKERGWSDIGYHFVIRRNGVIEKGRDIHVVGAHVTGKNSTSIGICMVGGLDERGKTQNNFTDAQFASLIKLLSLLKIMYPFADIAGHNEFSKKDCPSFNVKEWVKTVKLS